MLTNHLDDDASDASWALLELKNSSARVLPINLDPVSVVTGLPRGIYTSTTMTDSSLGRISTVREHCRDANANGEQELACFEIDVNKYTMRKELFQIGRNSSKGDVDIDVTQTDNTATGFVSRIHCEVRYDARSNKFYLSCFGKNGVFVDDIFQRRDDGPLQLRPSCVLTFPSTQISIRFTSLIPDPDQSPIRNGGFPTRTCTYTSLNKQEGESRLPSGQKAVTGTVSASADICADCSSASCRCYSAGRQRSFHIPESDTPSVDATHDCDISQRTVSVTSLHHSHPGRRATLQSDSGLPQTPSTLHPLSTSLPHSLFSLAKSDASNGSCDGREPSACAQVVFRQPSNGCAKSNRDVLPANSHLSTPTQTNGEQAGEVPAGDRGPKPPYSYAQLIAQAIANAPQRQLTLSGIYAFITKNYPYFHANDKGWQNSIRHNLSLNRFFMKVPRSHEEPGKGMFWRIEAEYEDKLITTAYRKRRQRSANSGPDASGAPRRAARSKGRSANPSAPEIGLPDSTCTNGKSNMLARPAAQQNVCESAPDSPCSPTGVKSPPALTATLTASLSASTCSSRNTSPTCDNELLGVVQPFSLAADTGVFALGASKSISLPHSPVTTFLIDELKQRSVDVVHSAENDSRQIASARSTPVFSIAAKQPLMLPTFTAQSPVNGADKQQQQLALFIQSSPGRHCALPNGRMVQPDMLTPPNSASSSNSNCRSSSCTSETHSKCDPLAYLSDKPRHAELPLPTACCAKPAILVDSQLHSYLQQQSGLTHPSNALLTRQYSSPAKSSEHALDGTALLHGLAHGKRPMDNGNGSMMNNCTGRSVANNCHSQSLSQSQSSVMRANGHAVPLKKRCYFNVEVEQGGQQ